MEAKEGSDAAVSLEDIMMVIWAIISLFGIVSFYLIEEFLRREAERG